MKLTCVSTYDARDANAFGQRCYYKLRSINELVEEMGFVGPLRHRKLIPVLGAKREYYRRIAQEVYFPRRDAMLIRYYAQQITKALTAANPDIILSPISPGSQPVAFVECKHPIVIWTDSTFAGALNLHYKHLRVCAESIRDGLANERAALDRAKLLIYYTQWAAESAIRAYEIDPAKVAVIPPGAWLEGSPDIEEAAQLVAARPDNCCRLLFIGVGWLRKGGNVALEVAKRLNAAGLKTELTIIGCNPAELPDPLPDFVRSLGYINRESPEGMERFAILLRDAHFLILPSPADASPLVCMEACAYAVPCLATDVGGIPDIVRDDINGKTFPLNCNIDEYCDFIYEIMSDTKLYKELALSALNEYRTRLNTKTAATQVMKLIRQL